MVSKRYQPSKGLHSYLKQKVLKPFLWKLAAKLPLKDVVSLYPVPGMDMCAQLKMHLVSARYWTETRQKKTQNILISGEHLGNRVYPRVPRVQAVILEK